MWAGGRHSIETQAAVQGIIVDTKREGVGKIEPFLFPQLLIYQQSWQLAKGKAWFSLPGLQTPFVSFLHKELEVEPGHSFLIFSQGHKHT